VSQKILCWLMFVHDKCVFWFCVQTDSACLLEIEFSFHQVLTVPVVQDQLKHVINAPTTIESKCSVLPRNMIVHRMEVYDVQWILHKQ
jgi:hypothetical protein